MSKDKFVIIDDSKFINYTLNKLKNSKINSSSKINENETSIKTTYIVPPTDYTFAKFSPSVVTVDIGIPIINQLNGKKVQDGFMLHDIPGWKNRNFIWSFANLTLYESSGKATGVFVINGRITNPDTGYPYYTMISEKTGNNY